MLPPPWPNTEPEIVPPLMLKVSAPAPRNDADRRRSAADRSARNDDEVIAAEHIDSAGTWVEIADTDHKRRGSGGGQDRAA